MVAQYVVNQKTFIAPNVYQPGTIINYDGPPGPHLDPVNDEAKEKLEAWYRANPHAAINPIDALPMTVAEVVAPPPIVDQPVNVGILGSPGAATDDVRPGPETQDAVVARAQAAAAGGITGSGGLSPKADDPALGDPTKPGEKGAETKAATDEANAEATDNTSALSALKKGK